MQTENADRARMLDRYGVVSVRVLSDKKRKKWVFFPSPHACPPEEGNVVPSKEGSPARRPGTSRDEEESRREEIFQKEEIVQEERHETVSFAERTKAIPRHLDDDIFQNE